MSNNLIVVPDEPDESWGRIVDSIILSLEGEDIPDQVIRALELLLSGFPVPEVARQLSVKTETVRRWLVKYPRISEILADNQPNLVKWRMTQIDQQFLQALEVSKRVLELPMHGDDVNAKLVGIMAAQARYIIGLRAGQKQDITVTHEMGDSVLKAREDALEYLAGRLLFQDHEEPIETTIRIIDNNIDDQGPMVDEYGNAPFGEIGTLDIDSSGILCHICGQRYKSLKRHVLSKHGLGTTEYELMYGLEEGTLKKSESNDGINDV